MELRATHTAHWDCGLALGATRPSERRMLLPAPFLFFITVSLATLKPTSVAKESRDACEEIQTFRGIQDASARPGKLFFYPISPFAFQGRVTHYKVTLANGSALPKWLEFNPNTNTLLGLPMLQESGEYRLTVAAHGEACGLHRPAATADFALHVHSHVTVWETQSCTNRNPVNDTICSGASSICSVQLYARDISVTFAEIIIQHTDGSLAIQERLSLIYAMAEYLYMDPSFLTLTLFTESVNKRLWNLTILGEDIKYTSAPENRYVGLLWPIQFGSFALLYELVEVLRHNARSSHLSQLLGYEIVGWRIYQKGSNERNRLGKRPRRQLMPTPRPTLRPSQIGMKQPTTEAFTFWSTTRLHTGAAVRPSASSSSLYEAGGTIVSTYTGISFHSGTLQQDAGASQVHHVQISPSASTSFQSLSSSVPELSPSLMTRALTEFARQDHLSSSTPPISESAPSQAPQQDAHSRLDEAKPTPHGTEHYCSPSGPTDQARASGPRSVWPTVSISVSPEETSPERTPPEYSSKEFVTLAHSSPYTYPTASRLVSQDPFLIANLSVLSTMSSPAKERFSFFSVDTSLFLLSNDHQNQDLSSNGKHASESFMYSLQTKEHLFTEENGPPLTAFQTGTPRWGRELNWMDILSASDSATTDSSSAYKLGLVPHPSPTPQLYHRDKIPVVTMHTAQAFSISPFVSSEQFRLIHRISRFPTELPSPPSSTPREPTGSFGFLNASPGEELFSDSSPISPNVFKTDERTSWPFMTVAQTNRLLFMKDQTATLIKSHGETPFWNEPPHLIYGSGFPMVISSSLLLGEDSLPQEPSQLHLWYSYPTLLLSSPLGSTETPKLPYSAHDMTSYATGGVRIPMACPEVLLLEASGFVSAPPSETKAAFYIARTVPAQHLGDSTATASQAGLHTASLFPGVAGQTNTSPRVVNVINRITATIGCKFSFSVPADMFYDHEDGDTRQLTLGMRLADGSPVGPENWLHFNPHFQTMHGYPLANDFQYSPQEFLLFATDSEGLRTSGTLTIELCATATTPCHTYTIRTQNSYHSFLRERERVYLLFEKLSKYLSLGDPGNMILLHLGPGSTLITWYEDSFCARSNGCARDEIQEALVKLRQPGGQVHPDFVEAMLPEYTIYQTEDVAYGGTCSSNQTSTTSWTIAAFKDHHCWIKNVFLALVISICATIIILVITFCYCKRHKEVIGSSSPSFHGTPRFSSGDFRIDMLKSRKSPIVEQEVPPPAELRLPVPTACQQHLCRPRANLDSMGLPPAPKYRLPPLYRRDEPSQTCDSCNRMKPYSRARIY